MSAARLGWALALAAAGASAAPLRITLLQPDDDPRLQRNRVERAYFGHPTGPAQDGLALALKDSALELDAAGASLALDVVPVASAEAARAAAQKAEKAGALAVVKIGRAHV